MCKVSNDPDRLKQAMHNNMANVPVARGADKTHKNDIDENVGPPLRLIVAAKEAPNSQISENLCDILKPLAEKMNLKKKTKLTSSEELCVEFDNLVVEDDDNEDANEDKIVICSLDFEKYYPSMTIDDCVEIIVEEWLKSDLNIEVDTAEMGLYLAIVYDRQELSVYGLRDMTSSWVS